jgi:protein TonB
VSDECDDDSTNRLLGWADRCSDVVVEAVPEDADLSAAPVFTPMTVRPEILNRGEVLQALMRLYPAALRDAGIGGTVEVWFFISEDGTVIDSRVSEPSTHPELNEAALEVANVFKFSPALNRETNVQVWIRLPITFEVQ